MVLIKDSSIHPSSTDIRMCRSICSFRSWRGVWSLNILIPSKRHHQPLHPNRRHYNFNLDRQSFQEKGIDRFSRWSQDTMLNVDRCTMNRVNRWKLISLLPEESISTINVMLLLRRYCNRDNVLGCRLANFSRSVLLICAMVWWSRNTLKSSLWTNTSSIIFSFIARLLSSIVYSLLRIFLHLFQSSSSSKFTPVNAKTSFCLNTIVPSRRFKMIGWKSCSSRHN